MSIWTSKARAFALLAALTTAACDTLPLPAIGGGQAPPTEAALSRGAVQLSAPQGYCIDRRSLRDRFALLSRCDTLGAEGFFGAWELALITVSTLPVTPGTTAPDAAFPEGDTVVRTVSRGGLQLTQLRNGDSALDGVSDQYWRTAFVVNETLVSLALYAPETSTARGDEGARILQDLVRATTRASNI